MTCGECGTANPAGQRFCGECGQPLARVCPTCGASVTASQKFCGECATPLTTPSAPSPVPPGGPGAAPVTERRVCSVLFADLVGFTTLSEARDPEEVRELLSTYFDTARTVIGRYGGLVEKFIGDAVMAVWGTPVATDSDAERAVRAGLDLVAEVAALGNRLHAPGLSLRAGVVTGDVAVTVGAVGQGMVAGDAVNTAARVQGTATPGTVWVDEATQRLARAGIGFQETGLHQLKGKAEPVALWQATRLLGAVGGGQRIDGLEAPMVGRDAEDRTLRELLHATWERSTPRLVVVTGPAGVGKTRLGWEFEKYVDGLLDPVFWHRGRCLSYGDGVAYWALAEAMRQRFGIAEEDTREEATAAFLSALESLVPDAVQRSYVGVRLGRLLDLRHPDDAGAVLDRDELFAGWRLFLERLGDTEPVVLLVEDAEHADDGLLDFLEHVVDWARTSPVFTIVFGRSELIDRRPGLGAGRNRATLTLDALDDGSMRTLVSALVRDLPDSAVDAVVGQAQGNPLFAVETIRSLIDRDAIVPVGGEYRLAPDVTDLGVLSVPDSLHGLLAARLDALEPAQRSLVADAAVLGTTFPADALAALSGLGTVEITTHLAELVRRGVLEISTDPLSPQRGHYGFSQNMLRSVAYETLSRRDRKARHLAVAAHLQTVFTAGGGDEVMEVVARHYLDALDASAADDSDRDDIREQAVTSLVRAGERSTRAGARQRAAASFVAAADLVEATDPARAAELLLRAAEEHAAETVGGPCHDLAARARTLYERLDRPRDVARAMATQGIGLRYQGRTADAATLLDQALVELRTEAGVDTVRALDVATVIAAFGDRPEALALAHEALGVAQAVGVPDGLMAKVFTSAGIAATFHGRRLEALAAYQFATDLAERAGESLIAGRVQLNLSAAQLAWEPAEAAASATRSLDLATHAGDRFYATSARLNLALARLQLGEWDTCLELLAEESTGGLADPYLVALLSVVRAMRGDLAGARAGATLVDELGHGELTDLRGSDDVQDQAMVCWMDATLAAAEGDLAAAAAHVATLMSYGETPDLGFEGVLWGWPLGLWCAFEAGLLDQARALVDTVAALPPGTVPPMTRGLLSLAQARFAALDGPADEHLDRRFAEAVATVRDAGSPYHLAHALLDHAAHLRATGRDASALVDEALLIGERLSAADVQRRATGAVVPFA